MRFQTVLVVTASHEQQSQAVEIELAARQRDGLLDPDILTFAIPDPSAARVGSGGATFNALLTSQEEIRLARLVAHFTARHDVELEKCKIFMIHSGGDSQRLPAQSVCGKAWSTMPLLDSHGGLRTPLDVLIDQLLKLFSNTKVDIVRPDNRLINCFCFQTGLIVASSDVLLLLPTGFAPQWPDEGACGIAIPADKPYGPNHGVYKTEEIDDSASNICVCAAVSEFYQKASVRELEAKGAVRPDGQVLLDTGVVYFSSHVVMNFIRLCQGTALRSCTYHGLDSATPALRVELYSDILLAMSGGLNITKDQYLAIDHADLHPARLTAARELLWFELAHIPFFVAVAEGGIFRHVGTTPEYLDLLCQPSECRDHYHLRAYAGVGGSAVTDLARKMATTIADAAFTVELAEQRSSAYHCVMNSMLHAPPSEYEVGEDGRQTQSGEEWYLGGLPLGKGSVVEHSELSGDWQVAPGSLVSGVRSIPSLRVQPGMAIQETRLQSRAALRGDAQGTKDVVGGQTVEASRVISVLGVHDTIKRPWTDKVAIVCGVSWEQFFAVSQTTAGDIWAEADRSKGTIWTAKLFPVQAADIIGDDTATAAALWLQHLPTLAQAGGSSTDTSFDGIDIATAVAAWRTSTRLSLREILQRACASDEFRWRQTLRDRIAVCSLQTSLVARRNVPVESALEHMGRQFAASNAPLTQRSLLPHQSAAKALISEVLEVFDETIIQSEDMALASRALMLQSLLFWRMAGWSADSVRSGPANHEDWHQLFVLISGTNPTCPKAAREWSEEHRRTVVDELRTLRQTWLRTPHHIGRAARHLERCAQLLTARCVYTTDVEPTSCEAPTACDTWVTATAGARIDLAGGWSDTPPITFEAPAADAVPSFPFSHWHEPSESELLATSPDSTILQQSLEWANQGGGMVLNVAIQPDGTKPIGARARRVTTPDGVSHGITLRYRSQPTESPNVEWERVPPVVLAETHITMLEALADFDNPNADSALLKAAIVCANIVPLVAVTKTVWRQGQEPCTDAEDSLHAHLERSLGSSLEVETWSNLPQGSGLGTSSILACTLLAALTRIQGQIFDHQPLTRLVQKMEMLGTTNGGWQDAIGGCLPGTSLSHSPAALPLSIDTLTLPGDTVKAFLEQHVAIVYTGRTRLAKNLLMRVLRQWAMREKDIVECVCSLRHNAHAATKAVLEQNAPALGACLTRYWRQKQCLAPDTEPKEVAAIIDTLKPFVHGWSLAGAGGGGYLTVVMKEPNSAQKLRDALAGSSLVSTDAATIHSIVVDVDGLEVEVGDE